MTHSLHFTHNANIREKKVSIILAHLPARIFRRFLTGYNESPNTIARKPITDLRSAFGACCDFHSKGVRTVIITSLESISSSETSTPSNNDDIITVFATDVSNSGVFCGFSHVLHTFELCFPCPRGMLYGSLEINVRGLFDCSEVFDPPSTRQFRVVYCKRAPLCQVLAFSVIICS